MDHNLEESLNLEGAITSEANNEVCVINLDAEVGTEMEFEQIVEQPMFMDTENEEVIVPDFVDDQFSLQEYAVQDASQKTAANTVVETKATGNNMEYENQPTTIPTSSQPKLISVKLQPKVAQQLAGTTKAIPRQVAIAPKPTRIVSSSIGGGRQFVITNKQVPNKDSLVKKPIGGVLQAPSRGNMVSVMPKIKLVSSVGQNMQYAQIIKQPGNPLNKQGITKLLIQAPKTKEQTPTVITKVVSQPTRVLTMQQKTVPVSINNEMGESPTKTQKIKLAKVQQISLKSPRTTPANSGVGHALSKKIVVTSQPSVSKPLLSITKEKQEGTIRMHQIHVPGKGVQYIQVLTKPPAPAPNKPVVVIADGNYKGLGIKNKIVQIGDKVISGPPPLVYTSNSGATVVSQSVPGKAQQKFVRIAPLGSKTAQAFLQKTRSSQSLLAPMSPKVTKTPENAAELLSAIKMEKTEGKAEVQQELVDPSEALRALVADAVGEQTEEIPNIKKFEIDYDDTEETVIEEMTTEHDFSTTQDYDESNFSVTQNYSANQDYTKQDYSEDNDYSAQSDVNTSQTGRNTPLIVIPSTFVKRLDESQLLEEMPVHVRMDNYSDSEVPTADLSSRPRRACRCTKSQCLKLYCDCFANGEFCNKCNCINCHNNLANEELRQKAIRGCLDRNPNAFRPKIGKAKTGGIDIIRRHITGCNCKRSGCLKNYCECFEAKIACSAMCKCVGCRNVEEALPRRHHMNRAPPVMPRQPCSFMTNEVIEAVCQCLIAAAKDSEGPAEVPAAPHDPIRNVIEEFSRCLQDIIGAAHHPEPHTSILDELGG